MTPAQDIVERREWLIRKDGYFYRPNCQGYTTRKIEAGRYTKAKAEAEAAVEPWHMSAIHQDEVPDEPAVADLNATISRLTADNEALRKERDEAIAAHHRTSHKAVKRLRALWREKQVAEARADALAQEVERLREALTPSADTKAAYSGEFYERIEVQNPNFDEDSEDDEPETIVHPFLISWTTTKKIMAAIRVRAALTNEEAGR